MDRRSKIIVSVVGIFIVLLALIGITYAYFLTRVEGNTHNTSISITTANLRIVYDDNDSQINATNIQPGDTVYTKTFTVTNTGNETADYEVYLENVINDFVHHDDLLMFITCKNQDNEDCNGYGNGSVNNGIPKFGTSTYPRVNSKLIENTIEPAPDADSNGEVHKYTLYLQFRDNGDQSDDMGKVLQGKIQIYDPKDIVSISGEITNYTEGDYVELRSDVKTSEIIKGSDGKYTYIFHGVMPEENGHTIYLKNRISDVEVGNKTINVTKGTEASINSDASSIVINDYSYNATVNIEIPTNKDSITLTGISVKEYNPYYEGSLAYEIYKNKAEIQKYIKDGETYSKNGTEINKNVKELKTVTGIADGTNIDDNGLFSAKDDYGISYIYRGSVINNYVDFAGFTWRIVRINGDGSVRLILDGTLNKICVEYEDDKETCKNYVLPLVQFNPNNDDMSSVGYTYGKTSITEGNETKTAYDLTHEYTRDKTNTSVTTGQSTVKQAVDTFYKTYLLDDYHDYISDTLFCGDKSLAKSGIGGVSSQLGYGRNETYYGAIERLWYSTGTTSITEATPTLKCVANNASLTDEQKAYSRYTVSGNNINGIKTNDDLIYPIALLSADELVMSGAFKNVINQQYYLYNSDTLAYTWWTLTPGYYIGTDPRVIVAGTSNYSLSDRKTDGEYTGTRPVINLSYEKSLYDEGDGTELNPYKVKLSS